jgi:type I restriction enzyme S subunit
VTGSKPKTLTFSSVKETNLFNISKNFFIYFSCILTYKDTKNLSELSALSGLPNGWKWVKLGEVISPSKARFEPLKNKNEKYIGLEHIEKGTGTIVGYSDSKTVRSTKTVFNKGDLLYGKLRPYLNKVAVAEFNGVCSTDILVFNKRDGISNSFLKYRMLMEDFVSYAQNNMSGVQHPRINFNSLSEFELRIPSYSHQLQIVSEIEKRFSEADNLEKAIDESLAKAEKLRQSILKQAFEGKLV